MHAKRFLIMSSKIALFFSLSTFGTLVYFTDTNFKKNYGNCTNETNFVLQLKRSVL